MSLRHLHYNGDIDTISYDVVHRNNVTVLSVQYLIPNLSLENVVSRFMLAQKHLAKFTELHWII